LQKARHLAKYMFPHQFGLVSSEMGYPNLTGQAVMEDEIKKKGRCKTPKRLKVVLGILRTLLRRHRKCGYRPLCNLACSSKV
ncbi:hypothetical protein K488DRAFT_28474, partial [Vararia minispora EC-137]